MAQPVIIIHGGARSLKPFTRQHLPDYKKALSLIVTEGYELLQKNSSALDVAEHVVRLMEDDWLFGAGRGSAITADGTVSMSAAIMDGRTMNFGSAALLTNVKNPVSLARVIMKESKHLLLAGNGAEEFARFKKLQMEEDAYFITQHQFDEYKIRRDKLTPKQQDYIRNRGTVGAAVLDKKGNIAAASSTGGLAYTKKGRIGDTALIGAGCFASNKTAGICASGDGEYIIRHSLCAGINYLVEFAGFTLQQACDELIHTKNKITKADLGLIAVNRDGEIATANKSDIMLRAWIGKDRKIVIKF